MAVTTGLLAAGATGSALSAFGSIRGGQTEAANLGIQAYNQQTQANANLYNATMQERAAQFAMQGAVAQSNQQQSLAVQALGRARAAGAESMTGFEGSTGMLLDQSAANAELDRENILYQGALQSQSLQAEAAMSRYNAEAGMANASFLNSQKGNAKLMGYLGAGASLLQGAGNYAVGSRMMGGKF